MPAPAKEASSYLLPFREEPARRFARLFGHCGARQRGRPQARRCGVHREHGGRTTSTRAPARHHRTDQETAQALEGALRDSAGRRCRSARCEHRPPEGGLRLSRPGLAVAGHGEAALETEPFRSVIEVRRGSGAWRPCWSSRSRQPLPRSAIDVVQLTLLFAIEVVAMLGAGVSSRDAVLGQGMGEAAAAARWRDLEPRGRREGDLRRRSRRPRGPSGKGAMGPARAGGCGSGRDTGVRRRDRAERRGEQRPAVDGDLGDPAALEEVLADLEGRGVFCRRVKVDVAFTARRVRSLRDELLAMLRSVRPRPARLNMRSTVTGEALKGPECDAAYWARNLREPVPSAGATRG